MKLQKTPIALACAFAAAAPFAAQAAPSVSFKTPTSGATVSGNIYQSSACEAVGTNIDRVKFYLDSTLLNTEESAPWNCNLDTRKFSNGTHTLKAVAYDSAGASAAKSISVNIQNSTTTNTPPAVSISAPANGATVSGTAVACAASASDTNGVKSVQFFLDGTALQTDTTSPYNCSFDSTRFANGAHTLKAVATDGLGATSSTQISVNVSNATTNTPPAVSFSKPANGATVSGIISCLAAATDSDGVKQLQWFLDSTLLNTESSAPFDTCNLDTRKFADGTHTLRAVATDNKGAVGQGSVSITIKNGTTTTANTPPAVAFSAPANGATLAAGPVSCVVTATDGDGVKQLQWFLDGRLINTELYAPYDSCNVNTTGLTGAHVIKAVATDNKGAVGEASITINVGSTTTANVSPTVAFSSPASGSTLSGTAAGYAATAADSDGSVGKVEFFVDSTLVATRTAAPYSGTLDTTKFANGTHALKAVATDNKGAATTAQISINVSNQAASTPTAPTSSLPSTNTKAIATFESLGLYWTPPSAPSNGQCNIQYRRNGDSSWKQGYPMWYDSRNSECRGSIVHLAPNTDYEVQFALPGQQPVAGLVAKTWSEQFPVAQTVYVSDRSTPLVITQGGTASGYVLYTPAPGSTATINVNKTADYNIKISAPYVIIRGLTLKGSAMDGIKIEQGAHDLVIEDNDISEWSSWGGYTSADGWKVARNKDAAIKAYCSTGQWLERTVVQRNRIHHPTYGANSWSGFSSGPTDPHPLGANAIYMLDCGGNHVWRYNDIYSSWGRYFMDGFGGAENFSLKGFPYADSDIYGNRIQHAWDDAIEAEGANRNVRIWGNYMDQTATGVATTSTSAGPVYVFRNVQNRSRNLSMKPLDSDSRLYVFKSGSASGYGDGRRFVFHNTTLQAPPPAGSVYPLGVGEGLSGPNSNQKLTNTVSRNNIYHVWKSNWSSIYTQGGTNNDLDYDLVNGGVAADSGAEPNRIVGTPTYASGNGWSSEGNGMYQLAPGSLGYDRGVRLPNFNDGFTGAAPDVGAHEAGTSAMRLGTGSTSSTWADSTDGGTTTSGTGTGSTTSSSGVCSTAICVVTQ